MTVGIDFKGTGVLERFLWRNTNIWAGEQLRHDWKHPDHSEQREKHHEEYAYGITTEADSGAGSRGDFWCRGVVVEQRVRRRTACRHIAVARAEWTNKDGRLQVYIELRDINYPGSNYALQYDPDSKRLAGNYYQAVQGTNFKVEFVRQ